MSVLKRFDRTSTNYDNDSLLKARLRSRRLSNIGRAVLGNAEDARSTREGKERKRLSNIGRAVLGNAEDARSTREGKERKRLSNIGRAVLGNAEDARSTREGKERKRLSNIGLAVLGNSNARGERIGARTSRKDFRVPQHRVA